MFRGELGVGALHIVFAIFSAGISNIQILDTDLVFNPENNSFSFILIIAFFYLKIFS